MYKKPIWILGSIIMITLGLFTTYIHLSVSTATHEPIIVTLTEEGYEPQNLTIPKGTVVIFTTTRDSHHWPASDLHPSHSIYPEFDPLEPIPPEESWQFTFDRTGNWDFHDHLRSYYRGTINVIE